MITRNAEHKLTHSTTRWNTGITQTAKPLNAPTINNTYKQRQSSTGFPHSYKTLGNSGYKKILQLFQDPRSILPGPSSKPAMFKYRDKQQLLTTQAYSMIAASILECMFITRCEITVRTQNRGVWTCIFRRLHLHHCVRIIAQQIPGLSRTTLLYFQDFLVPNSFSRTFQDLALIFPGLSGTRFIFQDFPGPGNFTNTIPGVSRRHGNREKRRQHDDEAVTLVCARSSVKRQRRTYIGGRGHLVSAHR